jgi:thiol-disulfide isomerase/thioredoxin
MKHLIGFLLLGFAFPVYIMAANTDGYKIKVKINGIQNKQVILGHYISKTMYPDDTVTLDSKGYGIFTGNKKLPSGMYLMYLPNSTYFDLVMGDDQEFSVASDTVDFVKSLSFEGSQENEVFIEFQRFFSKLRRQADSITSKIKASTDQSQKEKLSEELKRINDLRINKIESIKADYPDLFVSDFLRATLDVIVPDPPRDSKGAVIDSNWQYYYYKTHYFDNFNYKDARLLRTPFYEDKIMTFLNKVLPQVPDTLIHYVDNFIEHSRSDSTLFRYMLITLFNYYLKSNIMGMDAVQVHIADKYYIRESWWSDDKFLSELKERTAKAKPLLIGAIAPDAELMVIPAEHFRSAANDTALRRYPHVGEKKNLRQIPARYLVLIFWEAECGHCKAAVPELYKIYENSLKNMDVQVLAISTLFGEDGKIKWVDFVNQNGLYGWINAWNPYSYDFKLKYDVLTTPQIYILDENKKIVAKKIGPEQVEEIIKALSKS